MQQARSSRYTVQQRKNSCLRDAFVFLLWHTSRHQPIAMIGGRCRSRAALYTLHSSLPVDWMLNVLLVEDRPEETEEEASSIPPWSSRLHWKHSRGTTLASLASDLRATLSGTPVSERRRLQPDNCVSHKWLSEWHAIINFRDKYILTISCIGTDNQQNIYRKQGSLDETPMKCMPSTIIAFTHLTATFDLWPWNLSTIPAMSKFVVQSVDLE